MGAQLHINSINEFGYTVLPNLISSCECEELKNMLEVDHKKYSPKYFCKEIVQEGELANKIGEKTVYNLHNKNYKWFKLFENKKILEILEPLLTEGSYNSSEPFYLNNISARSPSKGHHGQLLHLDSNLPGVNYCLIANVLWMLDDFTAENGATRLIPGSHKWKTYAPDDLEKHSEEKIITGQKGSALIFNANIWHGGGSNETEASRWAVALGYARWFIKPSFDFMQNMPNDIYKKLTDSQKKLLGYNIIPPKDEFTRLRRKSEFFEVPNQYILPS